MSTRDTAAAAAAIAQAATAHDGVALGVGLAIFAVRSFAKYFSSSSALRRLRSAPDPSISGLRSLLDNLDGDEGALVVVRGSVFPNSELGRGWWSSAIVSDAGDSAVIVREIQTCLYSEWRGVFGWSFDIHSIFSKHWKERQFCSTNSVPFIIVEESKSPQSSYAHVNLDGSSHPLPLTIVQHELVPVQTTPYYFIQAIFGGGFPIALLNVKKVLPVGKEITVIGICRTRGKEIEIESCKELPFFLSDMKKDEIETELIFNSRILFWSGIILGTISASILGYAAVRNWWRWKEWRERRQQIRNGLPHVLSQSNGSNEEPEQVADGELCVICLARHRRSALVPCGHLVCCPSCALTVAQAASPMCPVCLQSICSSLQIFNS